MKTREDLPSLLVLIIFLSNGDADICVNSVTIIFMPFYDFFHCIIVKLPYPLLLCLPSHRPNLDKILTKFHIPYSSIFEFVSYMIKDRCQNNQNRW